jgi:hypothetical protein
MKGLYATAGVGSGVKYEVMEKPSEFKLHGHEFKRTVFMARGEKL